MIDFRYHVVSIVAVFLALAVGIVLGAGPLKEDLGSTLTSQVTQLRQEKSTLRDQLKASQKMVAQRDTYAELTGAAVVAGQLVDKKVALVLLPGADGGLVKRTTRSLLGAGATVVTVVSLTKDWADPSKATERSEAVKPLARLVNIEPPLTSVRRLPGMVLARALYGSERGGKAKPEATVTNRQVLTGLKDAGLITFDPEQNSAVSSTVVISGSLPDDQTDRSARGELYLELFSSLAGAGRQSVLASGHGQTDSPAVADPIVATVRADAAVSALISTVDDVDLSMGQSTLVLALRGEYDGTNGHYGLADDATAVSPRVPTTP